MTTRGRGRISAIVLAGGRRRRRDPARVAGLPAHRHERGEDTDEASIAAAGLAAARGRRAAAAPAPGPAGPPLEANSAAPKRSASRPTAGWTATAGVVHIPIERAIDLVAERGVAPLRAAAVGRRPLPTRGAVLREATASEARRLDRSPRVARFVRRAARLGASRHGAAAGTDRPGRRDARRCSKDVGIDQRLDEQLPLDLAFRDETGRDGRASATTSASGPSSSRSSTTTARCSAPRS